MFLLVALPACLEPEDDLVDFSEDWETCGTCGWEVTGDVTIVTTNHPGEHAARMGDNGRLQHPLGIVRELGDPEQSWQGNFTDGNWIEYSTDCVGPPRLAIDPFVGELAVRMRLEGPVDEGGRFVRRKLMFPPLPVAGEWETLTFRHLEIEAGAPCRLDNLRVMVSGGTLAY